jgi:WbqC-like protein family
MGQGKSIAILQSNYVPWKGYFDLIAAVDEFLILDEVQYTRRDWRNRNKIVVQGGPRWITIPVKTKGRFDGPIDGMETDGQDWAETHWKTIVHAYGKSEFFPLYRPALEAAYEKAAKLPLLTEVNELFLRLIAGVLGIATEITRSRIVPRTAESPDDRLVEICVARGATQYVSGPAARAYIEKGKFERAGVELRYADYSGYPVYDQQSETFEHGVSVLDLLMRCGPAARSHLKSPANRDSFLAFP